MLAGPETRTFTVGDAAQSIYAFRGADLESFRKVRRRLAEGDGGTAMLGLTGSFRSTPDVLAAVNLIGAELLGDYVPLAVGRDPKPPSGPAGPAVEILLTQAKGWGEAEAGTQIETVATDTPQNRIAEARSLAARLRELADDGVEPGSMVLLLRAFTHVDAYAEALELAGLDPYVVGGRGYWSSQQVTDALCLLGCVANPLDDDALLGALASPAAAIGPDALWMLRRIAGRRHLWAAVESVLAEPTDDDTAAESDDPERDAEQERWTALLPGADRSRLRTFHATLTTLRAEAASLPLDELTERTLEAFGYDLAALLMDDGLRRTANLLKLVRLAAEFEAHEGRDLRAFLEQATDRAALTDREAEAAVAAEDHAGVRVMTVHAAKGLEFDCVAVADLGRKLAAGGHPPLLRLAYDDGGEAPRIGLRLARAGATTIDLAGYRELNDLAADAEAEETGRLAYVAASRARSRLLLSGTIDPEKDVAASDLPLRRRSVLSTLLPALGASGADGEVVEAAPPATLPGVATPGAAPVPISIRMTGAGAESARRLSTDRRTGSTPPPPVGGAPPMLALAERGTAAARNLSYAALADYGRCGYRFLAERILRLGDDESATSGNGNGAGPSGMAFGRAVHELLEWSCRNDWRMPPPEVVAAATGGEGFGEAGAERAAALVSAWIESPLLAELTETGATFRPEVPFRVGLGERTVIRGTIDLLVIRPGKAPLFIDYKTDTVEPGADPVLREAYDMQRLLYAAAIADATGAGEAASAYVFLQAPDRPIRADHDGPAIAAGRAFVGERVARIRDGDFSPTADPGPSLCHDCPARARLCPYPPELTMGVPAG